MSNLAIVTLLKLYRRKNKPLVRQGEYSINYAYSVSTVSVSSILILSIEPEYQGKSEAESEAELNVKYVEPDVEKSNLMSSLRLNMGPNHFS